LIVYILKNPDFDDIRLRRCSVSPWWGSLSNLQGYAFFGPWDEADNQAKLFTYVGEGGGQLIAVS
jgi:hypothetical protein